MTSTAEVVGLVRRLGVREVEGFDRQVRHLCDCPSAGEATSGCSCLSCDLATVTPDVDLIVRITRDADALSSALEGRAPVGGAAIAAADMARQLSETDLDDLRIPAARRLAGLALGAAHQAVSGLQAAVSRRGLEDIARRRAALLAVPAIMTDPASAEKVGLDRSTLDQIDRAAAELSGGTIGAVLAADAHAEDWTGMPVLETQPEWQSLPSALADRTAARLEATGMRPGSLEAFVAEALFDDVLQLASDVADRLLAHDREAELRRPSSDPPMSHSVRRVVWRRSRFNLAVTLIDCGAAKWWPTQVSGGHRTTSVHWTVAAPILRPLEEVSVRSAWFSELPTVNRT